MDTKTLKKDLERKLLAFDFTGACRIVRLSNELSYVKKVLSALKEFMTNHLAGSCQFMMIYIYDEPRILACVEKGIGLDDPTAEWKQLLLRLVWLACRTKHVPLQFVWKSLQNLALHIKKDGEEAHELFSQEVPMLASSEFWVSTHSERLTQIIKYMNLWALKHPISFCLLAVLACWVFIMPERLKMWLNYCDRSVKGNDFFQEVWIRKKFLPKMYHNTATGDLWCTILNIANASPREGIMLYCAEMAKRGTHLHFLSAVIAIAFPNEDRARVHVNIPKQVLNYLNGDTSVKLEIPSRHRIEELCVDLNAQFEEAYSKLPKVIKPRDVLG